jgi:hypothetical protein
VTTPISGIRFTTIEASSPEIACNVFQILSFMDLLK